MNSESTAAEGERVGLEGCLGMPEPVGEVRWAEWLVVNGLNRRVEPVIAEGGGLLACVLWYEIDHLDAILFIARSVNPTRLWKLSELGTAAGKEVVRIQS